MIVRGLRELIELMIPRRCARQGPRHVYPDERLVDLPVGVIATGLEQCRQKMQFDLIEGTLGRKL